MDTRENCENRLDTEAEELAEVIRCLSIADEKRQTEKVVAQRSRRIHESSNNQSKPGLMNYKKTWMFANSRLPLHQPPFKADFDTWRLICMAARTSAQVYQRLQRDQREHYFDADWRHGIKAMVLKSTPVDDKNLIVFAIRGSRKTLVDWAVNLRPAPKSPKGFLDDTGNACHAGFLSVAKAMVAPAAVRLRQLLEQDPSRCTSSLLITGHSAGGAVASLLYMHMLATRVVSDLNILSRCFKRVHCITFGAPPVSFLPLEKPDYLRGNRSLFLSFINEGDFIVRADISYLLSLGKLLATPGLSVVPHMVDPLKKLASHVISHPEERSNSSPPYWVAPEATLGNAGRLILLRETPGRQNDPSVEAVVTTNKKLREVIFGDPTMHMMTLYNQRIEKLTIAAMLDENSGQNHTV